MTGYNDIVRIMLNERVAYENEDTFTVVSPNITLEDLIRYSYSLVREVERSYSNELNTAYKDAKF